MEGGGKDPAMAGLALPKESYYTGNIVKCSEITWMHRYFLSLTA